jgi:hypothetical protein
VLGGLAVTGNGCPNATTGTWSKGCCLTGTFWAADISTVGINDWLGGNGVVAVEIERFGAETGVDGVAEFNEGTLTLVVGNGEESVVGGRGSASVGCFPFLVRILAVAGTVAGKGELIVLRLVVS